ncbi:cytochrome b [Achromobacter deleyi]|uniref:cytochrome b n=1 Tax=Achromobacter deleyi TaxID=1353891 RepID=UPI00227999CF|nr:cytochrome b/b6 domain-containing protein [Achromobacter deleyi]
MAFAGVFALRVIWRLSAGRRLPPAATGWLRAAGTGVHGLLYLLMAAQIVDHEQRRFIGGLHDTVAWTIVVLALMHALAGLFHHYILRDGVLRRMSSGR